MDQRYYGVGTGRFNVPDPYMASGGAAIPGSWNRYSYTHGDPVNFFDPTGQLEADPSGYQGPGVDPYPCGPNWIWNASLQGPCSGGGGGGPSGGEGGAEPDPVGCDVIYHTGDAALVSSPKFHGELTIGVPVTFEIVATGGNGTYEISNHQTVTGTGSAMYGTGITALPSTYHDPPNNDDGSLANLFGPWSNPDVHAAFWDAPGWKVVGFAGQTIQSGTLDLDLNLHVDVKSGTQQATCDVRWHSHLEIYSPTRFTGTNTVIAISRE